VCKVYDLPVGSLDFWGYAPVYLGAAPKVNAGHLRWE
jgi:hypothetical protein